MNLPQTTFEEGHTAPSLLTQRAKELGLNLDAAVLERVLTQWQRLEAMALLVSAESLHEGDEPAMTFIP